MATLSARPAGDVDYDAAGLDYGRRRQAEPRIATRIRTALGEARTVLNVGAGSGNYEPADLAVVAIEPAAGMRRQRPPNSAPCVVGVAEALPFDDRSFDACMAVATVHQWPDLAKGLSEMRRVARGPVAVLTFDAHAFDDYWVSDYVPSRVAIEGRRMPDVSLVARLLGGKVEIEHVPVPRDCSDGFLEAFYSRPEALLDPQVRAAQSAWAFIGADAEARFEAELRADLENGRWDSLYGHWRLLPEYDGPLRLIVSRPLGPAESASSREAHL